MTPDRWSQIEALFGDAADLPLADRAAFLDAACRTVDGEPDDDLRRQVEAMLADDTRASAFFDDAADGVARAADGATTRPPERAGPWTPVRLVGRGGMGEVYLAKRTEGGFEQRAALKLIQPGLAPELVERFRTERAILASLEHPGIARLLDGGVASDGRPYLATEFVDGQPITDYADQHRLSVEERLRLFEEVCRAVAYAHRNLVVHRDIKPSNILVDTDGRVKLLDFGIARLLDSDDATRTLTGQRAMTPAYAAPEQVRGDRPTTATDAYALGVLLYELLTGRRPYALPSVARRAVEQAILEAQPTRPSTAVEASNTTADAPTAADLAAQRKSEPGRLRRRLAGDLDQIVLKALRKEPERRYGSAAELADDVQRHLAGEPVAAQPDTVGYRVRTFVRRNRLVVGAAAAVALALVAGASVALWQAAEARAAQAEAEAEAEQSESVTQFMVDLFAFADPQSNDGAAPTAEEMLARGIEQAETDFADEPELLAQVLNVVGNVYFLQGRYEDAEPLMTRALALRRDLFGDTGLSTAESFGNVGGLRLIQEDFEAADSLLSLAVAIQRAAFGPDDVVTLRSMSNLAYARLKLDSLGSAEALYLDVLARDDGSDSLQTATMRSNLGLVYEKQERDDDAAREYRAALSLLRGAVGDVHPNVGISLMNLSKVLARADRDAEALAAIEESDATLSQTLGPAHPATAAAAMQHASLLIQAGNGAAGIARAEAALAALREAQGPDFPAVARMEGQVAELRASARR